MVVAGTTAWSFLTNHAQVLIRLAEDPDIRLRELGDAVGITERAAHRIVTDLTVAGYVTRTRTGRRNRYGVRYDLPLPDPLARGQKVGDLLEVLAGPSARSGRAGPA
jgi:DNA-binding Lrp family transcriptional regulator